MSQKFINAIAREIGRGAQRIAVHPDDFAELRKVIPPYKDEQTPITKSYFGVELLLNKNVEREEAYGVPNGEPLEFLKKARLLEEPHGPVGLYFLST